MSLADAARIKNLEAKVETLDDHLAALMRRHDALEKYVTELPEPEIDPGFMPKRGPGRPKKGT